MNNSENSFSPFIPITLGLLAYTVTIGWNIHISSNVRNSLDSREEFISRSQNDIVKRHQVARKVGQDFESLGRDLIELSNTDKDAALIVKKYGLKINEPTSNQ